MSDPISAAIGGSAIIGGGASIIGGNKAASAQKKAAQQSIAAQREMFDITQQNLEPYNTTGQDALTRANKLAGGFNYKPTMAETAQTPGYQFNLNQGLKATQNAAAARGLGTSGAALKGAASYATGLADSTYQNQFGNALQSYQTNLGGLQNIANLGENAAAGVGNAATQTGGQIGSNIIGAGNAAAGSYMNTANAFGNAANSVPNGLVTNKLLGLYGEQAPGGDAMSNEQLTAFNKGDYYGAGY